MSSAASSLSSVKNGGTSGPRATRAAPVSVRIADFDGEALARSINVAWAKACTRYRVLDGRDNDPQPQFEAARHDHMCKTQGGRRSTHILLHVEHDALWLD